MSAEKRVADEATGLHCPKCGHLLYSRNRGRCADCKTELPSHFQLSEASKRDIKKEKAKKQRPEPIIVGETPIDQVWDFIVRDTSTARPFFKIMGTVVLTIVILLMLAALILGTGRENTEKAHQQAPRDEEPNIFVPAAWQGMTETQVFWVSVEDQGSSTPSQPSSAPEE